MADQHVITTTGTTLTEAVLKDSTIQEFKARLRGALLRPGESGYDDARKVFNAMIDKRPALIVRCTGAADVVTTVTFARTHDLLISVRGGGHSIAGKALCDGGVLIDLSALKGLRVDPARRVAYAQPGLRLGEFDRETQTFGLATTLGVVSNTGLAGLTLGGGLGWLNGKYGLACDNLRSVDVVTADGRFLTASPDEHADLFWGVRGGGGNFGIVTSFEYQLHPVGPVLGGMTLYDVSQAKEVLRFFREFASGCPDELSTEAAFLTGPDGTHVVAIIVCYCGAIAEGEKVLQPLRTFGAPLADLIHPIPYVQMQCLFDESMPLGRLHYWKANFLRAVSDDAIELLVEGATTMPSPTALVILQQMHGAASRVSATATAFAQRYEQYNFEVISNWSDPADSEKNIKWTRASWAAMQPFVEQSVYVNNLLEEEGEEGVRAAYGPNYERLVELKNKYDSTNFFRVNHNIKPTVK